MGDGASQNLRRPNLTYTASAPDDGRSWNASELKMSGALAGVAGTVLGTRQSPFKQVVGSGGRRIRPLPANRRNEPSSIASEVKSEGPGPDVTGLDTLNRSLAMELRPLGLPPWCVDQQLQSPHRDKRSVHGARVRRASLQQCSTWHYPRRDCMRPALPIGGGTKSIPQDIPSVRSRSAV